MLADRRRLLKAGFLVLSLGAVNGTPPEVHVPRPRNKRALAQRSSLAGGGAGPSHPGAMAMA